LVGTGELPLDEVSFKINRQRAIDYLASRDRIYIVDGYAGWDSEHRLKIRVICSRPYHALFIKTMLIRPDPEEAASELSPGACRIYRKAVTELSPGFQPWVHIVHPVTLKGCQIEIGRPSKIGWS
jgi:hypothetical protein